MRRFVLAALMCGVAHNAFAADMPDFAPVLRGAFPEGLSSSRVVWQGYYVGGQAAWGSIGVRPNSTINGDLQSTFVAPGTATYNWAELGSSSSRNTGFGGFVGYNSQWDDVVIGLEANYLHGGFKTTSNAIGNVYDTTTGALISTTSSSASIAVSDFGSLRARAGYAIGNFLPYVFAGYGVGNADIVRSVSATPAPIVPYTSLDTKNKLVYGYSAGVGIDVMLWACVFLRAEYEYQRFTVTNFDTSVNTVRAGVGYKF